MSDVRHHHTTIPSKEQHPDFGSNEQAAGVTAALQHPAAANLPGAACRLQFHAGFTFRDAKRLVPSSGRPRLPSRKGRRTINLPARSAASVAIRADKGDTPPSAGVLERSGNPIDREENRAKVRL
jgi:hypothetical protein